MNDQSKQGLKSSSKLSPDAPSFSFNPDASEFTPPSAPSTQAQADNSDIKGDTTLPDSWEDEQDQEEAAGSRSEELGASSSSASSETKMKETPRGGAAAASSSSATDAEIDDVAASIRKDLCLDDQPISDGAVQASSISKGKDKSGDQDSKSADKDKKKRKDDQDEGDDEPSGEVGTASGKIAMMEQMKVNAGDPRPHMNVVFIGHVDAGKSTMSGQLLYATGNVDKRTIAKYEKEAKTLNRESWFLAFIMDTNDEERAKGKTVEVGRAHFQTENRRFTVLDAPGHKNYVPNMIQGAAQADIGVLVISARKGEFETGYERGGQTREHALLAKTLGVKELLVVVNKMDDSTVNWSKDRYDTIEKKINNFLKKNGFKKKNIRFVPISAITGDNVYKPVPESTCSWYKGETMLSLLDAIAIEGRDPNAPLRIPILDKFTDRGTGIMGKIETGSVRVGQKVSIYPGGHKGSVEGITIGDSADDSVDAAFPGENVEIRIKGIHEDHIKKGFVLADSKQPVPVVSKLQAQLQVLDLEDQKVFTAGYNAIMHIHTMQEEITVEKLQKSYDPEKKEEKTNPRFVKSHQTCDCVISLAQTIACEKYDNLQQLGRFTIRNQGRTVAIGKITGLPKKALVEAGQVKE